MPKILISITSHQTIPNVLFIREVQDVDKYVFIISDQMKQQYENIVKAVGIYQKTESILVDAYSLEDVRKQLNQYGFGEDDEYVVNVTGGTKVMSLGVYQYFSRLPNVRMYYLPIKDNTYYQEVFPNIGQEVILDYRVDVLEYLMSYGIEILNPEDLIPNSKISTRNYFGLYKSNNRSRYNQAIDQIYHYQKNNYGGRMTPDIQEFLDTIQFQPKNSNHLTARENRYLFSEWFEDFTFYTFQRYLNLDNKHIKRGVRISLKRSETLNEMDIVFIYNNICHLVECKIGMKGGGRGDRAIKDFFEKTAYKLGALKEQFGLSVKPYLFTLDNRLRTRNGNIKMVYKKRAAQQNITIVDKKILLNTNLLNEFFNTFK